MQRAEYDEYIRRFNAEDATAFDDYLADDMQMVNGALEFRGVAGMRDHYENRIWPYFKETLHVLQFVSDDRVLAVQMWTNFLARVEADTLFGPVVPGDQFDYRGVIMYELHDGKFTRITVAYNSFTRTGVDGSFTELGVPH